MHSLLIHAGPFALLHVRLSFAHLVEAQACRHLPAHTARAEFHTGRAEVHTRRGTSSGTSACCAAPPACLRTFGFPECRNSWSWVQLQGGGLSSSVWGCLAAWALRLLCLLWLHRYALICCVPPSNAPPCQTPSVKYVEVAEICA